MEHWKTIHYAQCRNPAEIQEAKQYALSDFVEIQDKKLATLGKGSYGLVKLVQHKASRDLYALKTIDKDKIS